MATIVTINRKLVKKIIKKIILKSCKESNAIKSYGKNAYVVFSIKILIEDLRLSSNVAVTVTKNRKLLSNFFFLNPVKSQLPPNFMEMMHI